MDASHAVTKGIHSFTVQLNVSTFCRMRRVTVVYVKSGSS
jgi:hypothetical protein